MRWFLFRLKRGNVDADWAEKATELLAEVQLNLDLVGGESTESARFLPASSHWERSWIFASWSRH
jgi:hypothetical protein